MTDKNLSERLWEIKSDLNQIAFNCGPTFSMNEIEKAIQGVIIKVHDEWARACDAAEAAARTDAIRAREQASYERFKNRG